jgi:hypothetical protein
MSDEILDGVVECRIRGVTVTAELLSNYLRSWARHGVYFSTRHAAQLYGEPAGNGRPVAPHIIFHDALVYRFPYGHPNPQKRGKLNRHFLNPEMLQNELCTAGGLVVFPIPYIYRTEELTFEKFLDRLSAFLAGLPSAYRYAIGVNNPAYLLPHYFDCLHAHAAAHVFISSPTMSDLLDQARMPYALPADTAVVLTEPSLDPGWQLGTMEIIRRCIEAGKELSVYMHTVRPGVLMPSLAVLMETMSTDLAKLSPLKKRAA